MDLDKKEKIRLKYLQPEDQIVLNCQVKCSGSKHSMHFAACIRKFEITASLKRLEPKNMMWILLWNHWSVHIFWNRTGPCMILYINKHIDTYNLYIQMHIHIYIIYSMQYMYIWYTVTTHILYMLKIQTIYYNGDKNRYSRENNAICGSFVTTMHLRF